MKLSMKTPLIIFAVSLLIVWAVSRCNVSIQKEEIKSDSLAFDSVVVALDSLLDNTLDTVK